MPVSLFTTISLQPTDTNNPNNPDNPKQANGQLQLAEPAGYPKFCDLYTPA